MCFAEKLVESMVDENGRCGERGLSKKQFDIMVSYLEEIKCEPFGGWEGSFGIERTFYLYTYSGTIGRFKVTLKKHCHFHDAHTVASIEPWCDELPNYSESSHVGEIGNRIDIEVVCTAERWLPNYYGGCYGRTYILTFDYNGNCMIWKTSKDTGIKPGDTVKLRGTIKEHGEYKGTLQTVLTRCKVQ